MADRNRTEPRWKQDFPVRWEEDSYVTRREFTKFLGLTSLAFVIGTCWTAAQRWFVRRRLSEPHRVAALQEIPIGGYQLFHYPTASDPCILLRIDSEKLRAFSQNCTHLNCPLHFDAATRRLVCPCHQGYFSAEDGRPLAGPPKRPLEQFEVIVNDGQAWVGPRALET